MTALFQHGEFTLHSGGVSSFKIDCDALTEADWQAIAAHVAPTLAPFGDVIGVPTGGHAFARALRPYVTSGPALLVDDVLTTGASMEQHRTSADMPGLVLFARKMPPSWVRAVFVMGDRERELADALGRALENWDRYANSAEGPPYKAHGQGSCVWCGECVDRMEYDLDEALRQWREARKADSGAIEAP